MVEITFLGGANEVGRLSISLQNRNETFLFDYGIDVQDMKLPLTPPTNLKGVFLSHAHLDHCGFIPELYKKGYRRSVYASPATLELTHMLLRDSLHVQEKLGENPQFFTHDIKKMYQFSHPMGNRQPVDFKETSIELRHAGHVPGASSIILDTGRKRVMYTGDINFIDTPLMKKADMKYKNINVAICESTYHYKNHPDRSELIRELKDKVKEVLLNNGTYLLPCFALGRTQEMLLIMHDLGFPIYLDGMGIEATRIILNHPESVANYKKLKKAFKSARKIRKNADRLKAVKNPSIVITTSGMLNGGPIHAYISKLHKREDCALTLTGFQVEGTVGHTLMHAGRYVHEGVDLKPRFKIDFMDFSAHCGRDDMINFLNKTNPGKVILIHGEKTDEFANDLKRIGFNTCAPVNGEKIVV